MSYEDKFLVGVDLMPKLSIHLVNVAYKYKDMILLMINLMNLMYHHMVL